jgi:hypothetical protein
LADLDSFGFPPNRGRITGYLSLKKERILADNTKERTRAEAQFKKTQKQQKGASAVAAYVAEADAVRAKTARLRELRLAKEAADKAVNDQSGLDN